MIFPLRPSQVIAMVAASLAALTLVLVFMLPPDLVLSARDSDMTYEFVAWRAFLAELYVADTCHFGNPFTYAGQPFLGRNRICGALPSQSSFSIPAADPCIEFLGVASFDHSRMGNGTMGPRARATSMGSRTRSIRSSSDRSRLSPSLRRPSVKSLHHGMGPLDFLGAGSLDTAWRASMAFVGERGRLLPNTGRSAAIFAFSQP